MGWVGLGWGGRGSKGKDKRMKEHEHTQTKQAFLCQVVRVSEGEEGIETE